jgi:hypothetical protein
MQRLRGQQHLHARLTAAPTAAPTAAVAAARFVCAPAGFQEGC